jgi:serine/threonine protein kinase/cytochrome c-type biogenesis protein CcmH/NrfG
MYLEEEIPTPKSRFHLEKCLGTGGTGTVYTAWDEELERLVAIKLLHPELQADFRWMQRLKQEVVLASRVSHPNIVRVHDLCQVNGVRCLSMAYVEGTDLRKLLDQRGKLNMEEAVRIGRDICAALGAAHEEQIVHRDVKPRNILIDRRGNALLSDFGVGKSMDPARLLELTEPGDNLGTLSYFAPERCEGGAATAQSDLYALGMILYEMLAGHFPFGDMDLLQSIRARSQGPPADIRSVNRELPRHLAEAVMRCLAVDPADRFQSAAELLEALTLCAPEKAARAGATPCSSQPRRRPWFALAFTVLVASGAGAVDMIRHSSAADLFAPDIFAPSERRRQKARQLYTQASQTLRSRRNSHEEQLAMAQLEKAVELDPNLQSAWAALAQGADSLYDQTKDVRWLDTVARAARTTAAPKPERSALLAQAESLRAHGQISESIELLQGLTRNYPRDGDVARSLATACMQLGKHEEAVSVLERAIADGPADWRSQNIMGVAYMRLARFPEAIRAFRKSIELAPENVAGYNNLAAALLGAGRWDEAVQPIEASLRLVPEAAAYSNLGTAYFLQGHYAASVPAFEKAVAMNSNSETMLGNLAAAYRWSGQAEKAAATFEEAIAHGRRILQSNPNDALVKGHLAEYQAILGRHAEAASLIQEALSSHPKEPKFLYYRGVIAWLSGQPRMSLAFLGQALEHGFPMRLLLADPELRTLRVNPEFAALRRRFQT